MEFNQDLASIHAYLCADVKLKKMLMNYNVNAKVYGPWKNNRGRTYYCLTFSQKELIKLRGDKNRLER